MADAKSSTSSSDSLTEEICGQWRRMWRERIDDRFRAEGIAGQNYEKLFIERGTVVLATRSFKFLTLKEILEQHRILNVDRFVQANPHTGGWRRFARANAYKRLNSLPKPEVDNSRQLKKGGRGWLHF
ncbi:MAG: hypothetical protein ABSB89_00780 [Candidatus Bathyarchaeia archaeon]